MIFEAKDAATLQKAGITTLLDLALLLPKSFDDLSVGDAPCAGESTAEVECLFQHRRGSMLIVAAHCLSWEREIKIVIFNAKNWHFGAFKRGKKFFIHGKCDESFGSWQFVNPKIVSEPGRIAPKYKAALSDAAAQKLIKKYLSAGALLGCGLRADEAAVLLALHESSPRSVRMLTALNRQLKEGGAENFGERDDISNSGRIPSGNEILRGEIPSSDKILNDDGILNKGAVPSPQSSVAAEILKGGAQNDEIFGGKISNYPRSGEIFACEAKRGAANEILDGDQPRARCAEICDDENFSVQGDEDFLAAYDAKARRDEILDDLKADNEATASGGKISNDLVSGIQAATRPATAQATTAIPTIAQIASDAGTVHAAETARTVAVTQMSGATILRTLKFVEILNYLQKLSAKKTSFPAQIYPLHDISDWLASLPFEPTRDQLGAIKDIANDLQSPLARRRVVMGDVGSGKTLVILASAAMNYPRISYLMAPTSILAEQIYAEARRLLPPQIKVLLVKSGDREPNFAGAHLIIGTHALLYHELAPSNLIMVDEQHRFGSNQREKIARLTGSGEFRAHFIQFSATPIPRTLSMIQSELVSFSFLKQLPFEKQIKTKILQNDGFAGFMQDLRRELAAGNQAIIVYPLVQQSESSVYQSLEEAAPFWKAQFADVMITHGSDKDKEEVLRRFRDEGRLLITTTIVEVGISLPRLSVILIVGAERMGLASLHQLRGRVGRKGQAGRCYLYTKLKSPPQRLREFAATLDGFKVANIDLKNRQGGDLLGGSVQHGAMFAWYDYEEDVTAAAKQRLKGLKAH